MEIGLFRKYLSLILLIFLLNDKKFQQKRYYYK